MNLPAECIVMIADSCDSATYLTLKTTCSFLNDLLKKKEVIPSDVVSAKYIDYLPYLKNSINYLPKIIEELGIEGDVNKFEKLCSLYPDPKADMFIYFTSQLVRTNHIEALKYIYLYSDRKWNSKYLGVVSMERRMAFHLDLNAYLYLFDSFPPTDISTLEGIVAYNPYPDMDTYVLSHLDFESRDFQKSKYRIFGHAIRKRKFDLMERINKEIPRVGGFLNPSEISDRDRLNIILSGIKSKSIYVIYWLRDKGYSFYPHEDRYLNHIYSHISNASQSMKEAIHEVFPFKNIFSIK